MYPQDVVKIRSALGMAALLSEHIKQFDGTARLAELMDVAMDPKTWNYLAVMVGLDILDLDAGYPIRTPGDTSERVSLIPLKQETDWDEGADPPTGDFPA